MSQPFIFVGQQAVNLSHVRHVEFTWAVPKGDADFPNGIAATINLYTDDGNSMYLTGSDAEAAWDYIRAIGVDVVQLAEAKRKRELDALCEQNSFEAKRDEPPGGWR